MISRALPELLGPLLIPLCIFEGSASENLNMGCCFLKNLEKKETNEGRIYFSIP